MHRKALLGVCIAMLLNAKVKGLSVYRTVYYLPAILPVIVVFFSAQKYFIKGVTLTGLKGKRGKAGSHIQRKRAPVVLLPGPCSSLFHSRDTGDRVKRGGR